MSDTPQVCDSNEIVVDEKSRGIKRAAMHNMRTQTWLYSLSQVATFVGAPLLAGGLTMAVGQIFGVVSGASAAGTSLSVALGGAAVTGGLMAVTTAALGIMGIGALFVAAAVVTNFLSSRIYQACQFDNLEFNADSTARHLVKELQTHNMCMTHEQDSPCHQEHKKLFVIRLHRRHQQVPAGQEPNWAAQIEAQKQQAQTCGPVKA